MMKRKLASVILAMILATSQTNAGDLWSEYSHCCPQSYKHYILVWTGPWSESYIFMEDKHKDDLPWEWEFFIGFLGASGVYSPAVPQQAYRMMVQPSSGPAYKEGDEVEIPQLRCYGEVN